MLANNNFLQFVFTGKIHIHNKIRQREGCKTPIIVVQVTSIQIIRYPSWALPYYGHPSNEGDDGWAQVITKSSGEQCECRQHALHGVWRLTVEEFQWVMTAKHSAPAIIKYCGNCHAMLSGSASRILCSLFVSRSAAIAMAKIIRKRPIRCNCVSSTPFAKYIRVAGAITLSTASTQSVTHITSNEYKDAGGMVREPILVFITVPCWMKVVCIWEIAAPKNIPVTHIGSKRISIFSSSTSVTVHRLHELWRFP